MQITSIRYIGGSNMKKRLISLFTAVALLCMPMTSMLVGSVGASAGDESNSILSPGRADWLTASDELVYTDDSGNKIGTPDGGYRYKSAYATVGCVSNQPKNEGNYSDQRALYAIDSQCHQYGGISAGSFMGKQLTGAMTSDMAWAGGYAQYQVKGGTYIATALILHENICGVFFDDEGNCKNDSKHVYGFQVSADGSAWQNVTATINHVGYGVGFYIYKAVVQIPEDCKYYRVVLPGFNTLDSSTGWHNGADDYFWRVFVGPSVASAYDLNQYDALTTVPDSPEYIDIYKELRKAISDSESVNLNGYEDDEAMTTFVKKLADAKAYLEETHTHDEYIAMANALLEAKSALNQRLAPHKATIKQDDPKHILQPGVADWLTGSALLNVDGTYLKGSNGLQFWYITYTDYAKPGVLAKQDGVNQSPDAGVQISDYDFIQYDTLNSLQYMGRPVKNAVYATRSWAACNMMYRVYAGSYVSSALICRNNDETLRDGFVIQTSADGETWAKVDAPSITPVAQEAETGYDVYKAVIKMPEGHTYYRVFLPGAQMIDPDTAWYAGNPDFLSAFLGATISSMYDLTQYDDYADIPDATEYYGEELLTSTDEEQLIISEGFFKLQTEDLTVAQALALLDPATGSVRFHNVNGEFITDGNTKLTAGMKADILDPKGISLTEALGYNQLLVVLGNDLLSIGALEDIYLDYGADKTAEGLKLPKTVSIEAGTGNYDAEIKWDVNAVDFDPEITQTQQFTVKGELVLPEGVTNKGGIDLTVTVNVTVNGSADIGIRVIDTTKVKIDEENNILYVQEGLSLAELRKALMPVGDVNIVFYDADGELVEDESVVVKAGMMLDVETDTVLFASYEIVPVANSNNIESPDTGVTASVCLITLVMMCAAGLLILSKNKLRLMKE